MSGWATGWQPRPQTTPAPRRRCYELFLARFFGTLAPFFRASDRPIAIACFLLLTFLPERLLLSAPDLRFFIARPTFFAAPLEYFRFFAFFAIPLILEIQSFRAQVRLFFEHPDWNSAFD
jgi:hypothetical protein